MGEFGLTTGFGHYTKRDCRRVVVVDLVPLSRLVTSLPTRSNNVAGHVAVGRLVQLGTNKRAEPRVWNLWRVPIIGIIVAAQAHQFSVKFEVLVCAFWDALQKYEETDFKISVAGVNSIFGAV